MVAISLVTRFVARHQMLVAALQQVTAEHTISVLPTGEYKTDFRVNPWQEEYLREVTGITF